MFIVDVSAVVRTNSTELDDASRPRIIEPPGTLLLVAEAGMGKSCLVEELERLAGAAFLKCDKDFRLFNQLRQFLVEAVPLRAHVDLSLVEHADIEACGAARACRFGQ